MTISAIEIRLWLHERDERWTVDEVSSVPPGRPSVLVQHPASHGLQLELADNREGNQEQSQQMSVLNSLAQNSEIEICSRAPALAHVDLLLGLRTVINVHHLDNSTCRSLAFLMYEHGQITEPEAAWVAGFLGQDPPMRPQSPLG